jgi:uncharacterized protein YutE (UPF0331/DUF86 family)
MVDQDVILEKVNLIQDCLARINSKVDKDIVNLQDIDKQEIVIFNLQRAIQFTIDIAFHIIACEKLGLAQNFKEAFVLLEKNKIIEHELSEKLKKMVGFRNIVVHEYEHINIDILGNIVQHHLGDLEEFYTIIIKNLQIQSN